MQKAFALVLIAAACTDAANVQNAGARASGFLSHGMRPDVVARTLVQVQEKWRAEAASVAESNGTDASGSLQEYEKSCSTIVQAVMTASSGKLASVKEYMADVCGEKELEGWHQSSCQSFASAIESAMTEDAYDNRQSLDTVKVCRSFWAGFAEEERQRVAEERAARDAAEKKAEEERAQAEKKAAEERAEAEKKAAEERAQEEKERLEKLAEEKKKADEDAVKRAAEESAQRAADAKRLAEAAAAKLAAKKAEAEKMAQEADQKLKEAQTAAEETKLYEAQANATADKARLLHVSQNRTPSLPIGNTSFVQKASSAVRRVQQPMDDDDGDEFEHGDMEANARAEDPSDYSVHQFLAHDDGREGSDDSADSDDGAAAEIAKNKVMAKEDHFDSEDTPDDSFVQTRRVQSNRVLKKVRQPMDDDDGDEFEHGDMEANARAEDPSDYSVHQFLAHDDGREGSDDSGDSDDGAAAEIAKNKAMAKEDHFDSEDTPDDSFLQLSRVQTALVLKKVQQPMEDDDGDEFEHGDMEANARAEDPSDYSVHQFLAHDDGREGSDDSGDSDDGAAAEIAKNKAMAKEDHFDSEDTPDDDSFLQLSRVQNSRLLRKVQQPMDDDDGDEFEHGDMEANARAEDPSDYSVHQFLAHDDGREGSDDSGDSDDGAAAEIAKNKAMAQEDHFDSEDTPDNDA